MTKSHVHVLRSCTNKLTSKGGFQWPESGMVGCKDWNSNPVCGGGLHGWLRGVGNLSASPYTDPANHKWLVVRVLESDIVRVTENGGGKVKFPQGKVVFVGNLKEAVEKLATLEDIVNLPVIGKIHHTGKHGKSISGDYGHSTSGDTGKSTSGDCGKSTSGDYGKSTSGDYGKSTSGYCGKSTSGDYGQSTSGYRGHSTSGDYGQSTSGDYGQSISGSYRGHSTSGDYGQSTSEYRGHSTSGDYGQSISGYYGQSISGYRGNSTSGDYGQSISGYRGQSISGDRGQVKAGMEGLLILRAQSLGGKQLLLSGQIGKDALKPNVFYTSSKDFKSFKEV